MRIERFSDILNEVQLWTSFYFNGAEVFFGEKEKGGMNRKE